MADKPEKKPGASWKAIANINGMGSYVDAFQRPPSQPAAPRPPAPHRNRRQAGKSIAALLIGIALALAALVLRVRFGQEAALCNSALGAVGQALSGGVASDCNVVTALNDVASLLLFIGPLLAFLGIVGLVTFATRRNRGIIRAVGGGAGAHLPPLVESTPGRPLLIEPIRVTSRLRPSQVYEAADRLAGGHQQELGTDARTAAGQEYTIGRLTDGSRLVACQLPTLNGGTPFVGWSAQLVAHPRESGSVVEFAVKEYYTRDGQLALSQGYEEFRDRLLAQLAEAPATK